MQDRFGPEQLAFSGDSGVYRTGVAYDRRGFQGYALGKLVIVRHDGTGSLAFSDRPPCS